MSRVRSAVLAERLFLDVLSAHGSKLDFSSVGLGEVVSRDEQVLARRDLR